MSLRIAFVTILIFAMSSVGVSVTSYERLAEEYTTLPGIVVANFHTHSGYSDSLDPTMDTPADIFERYRHTRYNDRSPIRVIASLDHAGHLNPNEWQAAAQQVAGFNDRMAGDMLALRGFEVTGTTKVDSMDPRDDWGFGHFGVLGGSDHWAARVWGDGDPPRPLVNRVLDHYQRLAAAPDAVSFFCHPSLYEWVQPELLAKLGETYPWRSRVIDRMIGCELSAHSFPVLPQKSGEATLQPFYEGIGDGQTLATSNEACFRLLLQRGWRVGAMMTGDNHLPPYGKDKTVTGLVMPIPDAKQLTTQAVMRCLRSRQFYASEEPTAFVAIAGYSNQGFAPMGGTLPISADDPPLLKAVHNGGSSTVREATAVLVFPQEVQTIQLHVLGESLERYPKQELKSMTCLYIRLRLANGAYVISSPIWFDWVE